MHGSKTRCKKLALETVAGTQRTQLMFSMTYIRMQSTCFGQPAHACSRCTLAQACVRWAQTLTFTLKQAAGHPRQLCAKGPKAKLHVSQTHWPVQQA